MQNSLKPLKQGRIQNFNIYIYYIISRKFECTELLNAN